MKLLIHTLPFKEWLPNLNDCEQCIKYVDDTEYKIMPICVNDYIKFNDYSNNIFKNNLENIHILNNKSKFCKYMLSKWRDNIPFTYYYNFDKEIYINDSIILYPKMIQKVNTECGGNGISIIDITNILDKNITILYILYNVPCIKTNQIIQKYIQHEVYYVGHFLVLNGIIYNKIYFASNNNKNDIFIKKGSITNYDIQENISIDDSIFGEIFNDLNYSGFACSDFIIENNKIIIFEINPRPGGSLIGNKKYLNNFLDKLLQII
jgi:predicted ATP-grasp superfamily ATP-dependent carboligase